jgi:heptosyltransferase II
VLSRRPPLGRILVIRLTALGDVVLVEPVLRALRRLLPGSPIDLVTEARYADFAKVALGADEVIGWDRRGEDAGWGGVARVKSRLPGDRYDLVVDLQGKLRTRALAHRVDADRRFFLQKRSPMKALLAVLGHDPPEHGTHSTKLYLDVLRPLGSLDGFDPKPSLRGPPRATQKRIGLCPGASHATKEWPQGRFAELAARLKIAHPSVEVVPIGGPAERAQLESLQGLSPIDPTRLDVLALAELLATLELLITVDTGPAHVAAGLGVPVVVLFGPTSPVRWGPIGEQHRVVSLGLDCSPCSNTGGPACPRPDRAHACLDDLSVDRVLEVASAVLAGAAR